MSGFELKLYTSIGALLVEWRKHYKFTQSRFAEGVSVSEREIRRWEKTEHQISLENLLDIAEFTGIPMSVLSGLNMQTPIYYSLRKRRYHYSKFDSLVLIEPELMDQHQSTEEELANCLSITKMSEIKNIQAFDHAIYPTPKPLSPNIILQSAEQLPALNLYMKDHWGHHTGHCVSIPLSSEIYAAIRNREMVEGDITPSHISKPGAKSDVLYVYSLYSSNRSHGYTLLINATRSLFEQFKDTVLVAGYSVTQESLACSRNLGMTVVFEAADEYRQLELDSVPCLFETSVGQLKRRIRGEKRDENHQRGKNQTR